MRLRLIFLPSLLLSAVTFAQQKPAPKEEPAPDSVWGGLREVTKAVKDAYISEDMQREIYAPAMEEWKAFLSSLQSALEGTSLERLAALEPQARSALKLLERFEGGAELADWLRERIEMIEVAKIMSESAPSQVQPVRPMPSQPARPAVMPPTRSQPQPQRPAVRPSRPSGVASVPAVKPAPRPAAPSPVRRDTSASADELAAGLEAEALIAEAAMEAPVQEPVAAPQRKPDPVRPADLKVASTPSPAPAPATAGEAPMIVFKMPKIAPPPSDPVHEAAPEPEPEIAPPPAPRAVAKAKPTAPVSVAKAKPTAPAPVATPAPVAAASVKAQAPQVSSPARLSAADIPGFDVWMQKLSKRKTPASAPTLIPPLRGIFGNVGTPADLVWLAEVESSLNPKAKSPVGALGLFQLMPATAKELGLKVDNPEERVIPEKSARAAATYLKKLHKQLGDWPLAIAAYNAGPGRVRRTLNKEGAKTFAQIAEVLPVETRLYVPKVLAMVNTRAGVTPEELAAIVVRY